MQVDELLRAIVTDIEKCKIARPLLVGIDGMDNAGKSVITAELKLLLDADGKDVIVTSVDCFHQSREYRYRRGEYSVEGYFMDGYDYVALKELLLEPIRTPPFPRTCCIGIRDYRLDIDRKEFVEVTADSILLCDAVYLYRPELNSYWDYRIYVQTDYATCLQRALKRDLGLYESEEKIRRKYNERYVPAWEHYLYTAKPEEIANVIIVNDEPCNRLVTSN